MKNSYISVTLLVLLIPEVLLQIKDCNYYKNEQITNCCTRNSSLLTAEECPHTLTGEIQWEAINKDNGTFMVHFPIDAVKCGKLYKIELFVYENNPNEACNSLLANKMQRDYLNHSHTELQYLVDSGEDSCNNVCKSDIKDGEMGSLVLNYIFTGCYFIKITTNENSQSRESLKYLETGYIKRTSSEFLPVIYLEQRNSDASLQTYFEYTFLKTMPFLSVELLFSNPKPTKGLIHYVFPDVHSNYEYDNKLEVCKVMNKFQASDLDIQEPECTYKQLNNSGAIECQYFGLPNGYYSVVFALLGEPVRCRRNTIWGNLTTCRWKSNTTINFPLIPFDEESTAEPTEDEIPLKYALIMGSFLLAVLFVIIYIVMRRGKSSFQSTLIITPEEMPFNEQKVFLLYPRDCRLFMETMEDFRTLLSIVGKFEVYDMHDNSRFNEIASNPEGWLRDKLVNYKTILIASQCAAIQNEHDHTMSSMYRLGECFDNYFLSALRYINGDSKIASYKKLLVVNLGFDKENYTCFKFLNPFTRFELPDQFSHILADLKDLPPPREDLDVEDGQKYENTIAYKVFFKKYKEYEEYCNKKPKYLEDILKIEMQE